MQSSQQQNTKKLKNQCVVPIAITTPVVNGIIGGISSVITAYLFKPIWTKISKLWDKETL